MMVASGGGGGVVNGDRGRSDEAAGPPSPPLFSIGKVQFALSAPLAHLRVCNNVLILVLDASQKGGDRVAANGGVHTGSGSGKSSQNAQNAPDAPVTVVRIRLDEADVTEECGVPVSTKARSNATTTTTKGGLIRSIFLDPTGEHLLLSDHENGIYYLHATWTRARPLQQIKGLLNTVSWNKEACAAFARHESMLSVGNQTAAAAAPSRIPKSTGEILLGMENGLLFSVILDPSASAGKEERYCKQIHSVRDKDVTGESSDEPILGVLAERFPTDPPRWLILMLTSTRLVQYIGSAPQNTKSESGPILEQVMMEARKKAPPFSQGLPSLSSRSRLLVSSPYKDLQMLAESNSQDFVVHCDAGAFLGTLTWGGQEAGENVVEGGRMVPFPTTSGLDESMPFSMEATEYHLVLGFQPKSLKGLCTVNDSVTFEGELPIWTIKDVESTCLGIVKDPVHHTLWTWTQDSIFEILIGDEQAYVWRIYKDLGRWEDALRLAPDIAARDEVRKVQGWAYFESGRYNLAATSFALSSEPFERIALEFQDRKENDSLSIYITARLERLSKSMRAQRTMLAMWLVDLFLEKMASVENAMAAATVALDIKNQPAEQDEQFSNLQTEFTFLVEDFNGFLQTYKQDLDSKTVMVMLAQHGRPQEQLYFAELSGRWSEMVDLHIREQRWLEALLVIAKHGSVDLISRHAQVLMRNAPQASVDVLLRFDDLDYQSLMPALFQDDVNVRAESIRYHETLIQKHGREDDLIHDALVALYISAQDTPALLQYLESHHLDPKTDLQRLLRLCRRRGLSRVSIQLYGSLGAYDMAVDLALQSDDVELAKAYADKAEDAGLVQRLWLNIAKYVIEKHGDIRLAVQTIQSTNSIDVADVLPFFPDFTRIDDFKDDIVSALEAYGKKIEILQKEIGESDGLAMLQQEERESLTRRKILLREGEVCSICLKAAATRPFILFPCQHAFHENCLIASARRTMRPVQQKKFASIQAAIAKESMEETEPTSQGTPTVAPLSTLTIMRPDPEDGRRTHLDLLKQQLTEMLECQLCGEAAIRSIEIPFASNGSDASWVI